VISQRNTRSSMRNWCSASAIRLGGALNEIFTNCACNTRENTHHARQYAHNMTHIVLHGHMRARTLMCA